MRPCKSRELRPTDWTTRDNPLPATVLHEAMLAVAKLLVPMNDQSFWRLLEVIRAIPVDGPDDITEQAIREHVKAGRIEANFRPKFPDNDDYGEIQLCPLPSLAQ